MRIIVTKVDWFGSESII